MYPRVLRSKSVSLSSGSAGSWMNLPLVKASLPPRPTSTPYSLPSTEASRGRQSRMSLLRIMTITIVPCWG